MDRLIKTVVVVALAAGTLLAEARPSEAKDAPVHPCDTGTLVWHPADLGDDVEITNSCTVLERAGPYKYYKYGDVNIRNGGSLIFTDATIDFWASSILVENGGSLIAGSPSAPIGTKPGGVVTIHLYGQDQGAGTGKGDGGQGIGCVTDPLCGIPAAIWNSNGNGKVVLPGGVSDFFYQYKPLPYDDGGNPAGYFGYKVLAVSYGGTLQLFGKKGATYSTDGKTECGEVAPSTSGTSWVRLNATAKAGTSTLTVDRPVSWKKDDQIVVTTTDYLPGHSEQLTVGADVTCGTTITVDEALKYDHNGTRYPLPQGKDSDRLGLDPTLRKDGAETRAAVALLTRSIRIVSAGDTLNQDFPAESTGYFFGGHLVARQGFKTFQVQGVEFFQMGQGGRLGHYPIHFHMARKTPQDPDPPPDPPVGTFIKDSSIHDSMTRWIVLHGTQDVTLARNVGYKSIGHGFYLEDGTEINNTLLANLGVFARAAVDNVQNPRKVPGILAAPDLHGTVGENVPFRSDYDHPTVFWIMNGWNDFQDNMAAGAGTCGVCYWLLPGYNSTMSRDQKWESYASMQSSAARAGMAPLKSFIGNSCVSAMTSFQTITATEACQGVGPASPALTLPAIRNPLASNSGDLSYYPSLGDGGHFPTQCGGANADPQADCSSTPDRCSADNPNCMVTVLDGYTTSFNWAAFNFAAIWLRPQWYLVTNSVITDAQQAGLTMVTGGGYSASDVIPGHWALVHRSVFIGHTQDDNPFASDGGPFNPLSGLRCAEDVNENRPGNYCLSVAEGVSHQVSNFGMYQRLFSVYDGPAFQDSNAYLNIKIRDIDDCSPFVDEANKVGRCDPKDFSQGRQSAWLAGDVTGLPKATPVPGDPSKDYCYMPNAAIGWKQPNGFYYPPAFHSTNLFFKDVDVRHFVVTPLFLEGTLTTDTDRVAKEYCNWSAALFTGFAGNDRQTVLNDDDGTLTGYKNTTVINLDDFFLAPVEAIQCRSDDTSRTSPYEYVTTVVYPKCVIDGTCAVDKDTKHIGDWDRECTNEQCYGVPLYRQDLMPVSDKDPKTGQPTAKSIRMMGQETGQRSTLTVNHGTYYLDTTVGQAKQCPAEPCRINVFKENETYYLFTIFAKESTEQTYRFYVGQGTAFNPATDIKMVQADVGPNPVVFTNFQPLPAGRARWLNDNKATAKGVVEVVVKLSDLPDLAMKIKTAKKNKCQPATYCTWNDTAERCEDANSTTTPKSDEICRWAGADLDCPDGGCYSIVFTLPAGFAADPATDPRPSAVCLPKAAPWDVSLDAITVSDGVCPQASDTLTQDFCQ